MSRVLPRVSQLLTVIMLVVASALVNDKPARASDIHAYSYVYTQANAWAQTGLLVYRADSDVTITAPNCSSSPTLGTGDVVYQSAWMYTQDFSFTTWFELGTGHRASSCRFWFWGYGDTSGWHPYGWQFISTYDSHTFDFYRINGNWSFYIDSSNVWNLTSTWSGTEVLTGLETYESTATAPATHYGVASAASTKLQYTVAEGPWGPWPNGTDNAPTAPLCGRWATNPVDWIAGENTTC